MASEPALGRAWAEAPAFESFAGGARRSFFGLAAVMCAGGSVLASFYVGSLGPNAELVVVAFGLLSAAALLSAYLPRPWLTAAMITFLALDSTALAAAALAFRGGAGDAALGAYGVLVCVVTAAAGRRAGIALACYQAVLLVSVHVWLWPGHLGGNALALGRLALHGISVFTGLAAGLLVEHALMRHVTAADDRDRRFRGLLALAADVYWETDADHRLVAVADAQAGGRRLDIGSMLGRLGWELPGLACEPETLDRLRADADAREPFRDVPVQWHGSAGPREFLISGEPRHDARGVFVGFWGVARDITEAQAARAALVATESRYRDLFALSPAPLVVHRDGRVVDANPAALAMFGRPTLAEMLGTDILAAFEHGDSRDRAGARRARLHGAPIGTSVPVADYRLVVGGRRISVRATTVCVEAEGGPALLTIFADDTERLAAELQVRRSEALLSHLVRTTPDVVLVVEASGSIITMANPGFERVLGWSPAEATGRSLADLGCWADPAERTRHVRQLFADGVVYDDLLSLRARDGRLVRLRLSAALFEMDGARMIVVNGRDVTEAEREGREREAILDNASVGISVTREGRITLVNRHFAALFGASREALEGLQASVLWADEGERLAVVGRCKPRLEVGERIAFETHMRRLDGSVFLAHMRAHQIDPARGAAAGTVWIVEDITERRRTEQALRDARNAAEAASRAKSAFLANTSHELRTPLNGIVGLAELARDPALDGGVRGRYLEQIVDSSRALAAIISDILDLSKIEAGRLELESAPFDLADLLRTLEEAHAPQAAARGLALRFEIEPATIGTVRGDALRVRQIVANFLGNALKFTAEGGVVVRAARPGGSARDERVRIEVADTGPGIAEALRGRLFEPFSQADQSTTRRFGGTGLGLSISRELATLMGGEVGVESEPGRGSRFWAELPLPSSAEPCPTTPAGEGPLHGAEVLMVEDNVVNMLVAVAMIERWGVKVTQATNGAEAVEAVRGRLAAGRPFDAVLMDVQMPVMSGYEATRNLRALAGAERLPIIALTAAALVSEREAALAAGMNDFLTKPIDPERLRAALARWCRLPASSPSPRESAAAVGTMAP